MRKMIGVGFLMLSLPACGGGSSSPSAPAVAPTPIPKDGVVVLSGAIGGKFTFSSSPARLSRTLFGCGDASITIPYRETAGGAAVGADYEVRVTDLNGFVNRDTGKATSISIAANESGVITFTERFLCVEYTASQPPGANVALNFAGRANGTVSQLRGSGSLTPIE
jgi:hypothetical protein